jgi:Zn-dependent metalloprotease
MISRRIAPLHLWVIAAGLAALPGFALAQSGNSSVNTALETAKRTNPGLEAKIDPATGLPSRIRGLRPVADPATALTASRDAQGQPRLEDVRRIVEAFMATSEVAAAFPQGPRASREVTEVRRDPDVPGQTIARVTQKVDGIPVFGSSARYVVSPSLAVTEIVASFSTANIASTTARVSEAEAVAAARRQLGEMLRSRPRDGVLDQLMATLQTAASKAELAIFDPALMAARGAAPGPLRLTWLVTIDSFKLFVDAQTGTVIYAYRDQHGIGTRRVYDLAGTTNFPGQQVLDEAAPPAALALGASAPQAAAGASRAEPVEDAKLAFQNSAGVRDYYLSMFGRRSFNDNGRQGTGEPSPFESYVRYGAMQNARWCKGPSVDCPKANVMVYGPSFASALDVVGHEVTHGVIAYEADLVYADEAGAVNEALSDIFGTLIEFIVKPQTANWVIGEDLPGRSVTKPLRSMADPPLQSPNRTSLFDRTKDFSLADNFGQPDHYSDYVKRDDPLCNSTWDYFNGCVHFNSGILNKMAFLIAEGGRHRGVTVQGIGRPKLARIAYRALTTRLNPSSKLSQAAEAFQAACEDLAVGKVAGFTIADCAQVDAASAAVGLKALPS